MAVRNDLAASNFSRRLYVFSKERCEDNASAEGVSNVRFEEGNAVKLPFPDESFDAVTSNYVYHNITGQDKQMLLRETLRVLKKGGVFAIHDLMSKPRYGDMDAFIRRLKAEGYEEVQAELLEQAQGQIKGSSQGAEPADAQKKTHDMLLGRGESVG